MSPGLLDITIHIDRSLGIQTCKAFPHGESVAELKRQIAQDDPTGQTRPEDFQLSASGLGVLADSRAITHELVELELHPAGESPEPVLAAGAGPSEEDADARPADSQEVPTQSEEVPERKLFDMLDRNSKGQISQRDVIVALRKHPPVRAFFGLPSNDEKGGGNLEARLLAIQDAFEAGSGLGEIAPLFDRLRADGTGQSITWDEFLAKCQKAPMKSRVRAAAALFHREHITTAAFVATQSWAEVPEGAACPGGLEYKMDMKTGRTLARLSGQATAVPAQSTGEAAVPAPSAPRMEDGGPLAYRPTVGSLFVKRSEDPASGKIIKVKVPPEMHVHSTGRIWIGPSGGRWTELDACKGGESGWALVGGPGFGLKGPALIDVAASCAEDVELAEDELPPGQDYEMDFLGVRRGRCKCGRCAYYRSPKVAVGG